MKKEIGGSIFIASLYILVRFTTILTEDWIVILLVLLIGWGLELVISGMINEKVEKLKDEQIIKEIINTK